MKKLLGTLALLATAVTPTFAETTAVLRLDVREGHHGSFGFISITGEAAEDLYAMLQIPEQRAVDRPGDGIKYQTIKTGEDLVCYRTVQPCRVTPVAPPSPRGPRFPGRPDFIPGPTDPSTFPGVVPPVAVQPSQPVCGVEDRVSYFCQTRINSQGRMNIERMGR